MTRVTRWTLSAALLLSLAAAAQPGPPALEIRGLKISLKGNLE